MGGPPLRFRYQCAREERHACAAQALDLYEPLGHVRYWLQKENIPVENLLVIVDDLNLPLGTIRLRMKGSDGGHNGLKNIESCLLSPNYSRLRFGIGNDFSRGGQTDFVLGEWSEEEKKLLEDKFNTTDQIIASFCLQGMERTMNMFNGK